MPCAHPLRPASGKCYERSERRVRRGPPASSPARMTPRSRSRRDGTGESAGGPDREDRRLASPGRRRGGRAAPRRRASRSTRVRNAVSSAGDDAARARAPVSAPPSRPGAVTDLARAARAQHEHVGRAVGQRGAERDRRRQPGVDEAPAVERDRRARRAAAAPPRPAARAAGTRGSRDGRVQVDRLGGRRRRWRSGAARSPRQHGVEQPGRELLVALLDQPVARRPPARAAAARAGARSARRRAAGRSTSGCRRAPGR